MRVRTGVDGFDPLVDGGLPAGASVILQGPSGNEKDAFALQFLAEGIRAGEAVAIVVSSTSPEEFLASLAKFGVDVQQAISANRLRVVDWHSFQEETVVGVEDRGHILRCSVDLSNVGVALGRSLSALPQDLAKRGVVEILSRALKMFDVDHVYAFAQSCKAKLARHKVTSVFLLEKEMHDRETLSSVSQPFDGVIDLERGREGNAITRKIGVLSMKDTVPNTRFHPCDIVAGKGLVVHVVPDAKVVPIPEAGVSGPEGTVRPPRSATRILRIAEERIRVDPQDPDALFAKASALAAMGDVPNAIAALDTLIEVDDTYPGLWVFRVNLFVRIGDKKRAQESRRRAERIMLREEQRAKSGELIPCPLCEATVPIDARECPSCGTRLGEEARLAEELDSLGKEAIQDRVREELYVDPATGKPLERRVVARPQDRVMKPRAPVPAKPKVREGLSGPIDRTNGLRGRTNGLTNGLHGRTNGLTNGLRVRTKLAKGLVNGMHAFPYGLTNGLTNGAGFTNGLGSHRFAHESRRELWKLYLIPVLATIILMAPLLTIVPNTSAGPTIDGDFGDWEGVASHALSTGAANADVDLTRVAVRAGVDYVSLLIEVRGRVLAGGPDPPGLMDGIYIFVDLDGASTGYPIHGLGADHLIEVQGAAGQVLRSVVYRASPSVSDPRDWNTWTDAVSIPAAAAGSRLETAVYWADLGGGTHAPVFLVASMGHEGTTDVADLRVGPTAGHLRVLQRHVTSPVLSGPNVPLLAVELTAVDTPATVSGLTVELLGTAPSSAVTSVRLLDGTGSSLAERIAVGPFISFAFAAMTLPPGQVTTWLVSASVSGSSGGTLGARIPSLEAVSAGAAIVTLQTVGGDEPLGYVGAIPALPLIDGAFAEWSGESGDAIGEPSTGGNPSVDVTGFGAVIGAANLTFHVRLEGPAFAGTVLTAERGKVPLATAPPADRDRDTVPDSVDPLPEDFNNDGTPDVQTSGDDDGDGVRDYTDGGPDLWLNTTIPLTFPPPYSGRPVTIYIGPVTRPPAIGEDQVRMFVDADNVTATGFSIGGLGADYLIELRGREGLVSRATVSAHDGGNPSIWRWLPLADVPFALGISQVEGRADIALGTPTPALYLEVSDWRGGRDDFGVGTRGATRSTAMRASAAGATPPLPLDIAGNAVYRLRNTNQGTETACNLNKVASTTAGSGPAQIATLNAGQSACWYLDDTSGTTIAAGDWESLLDISRTTALAVDAVSSTSGDTNPITWSHTTVSQTDGLILVAIALAQETPDDTVVNSVTYGGLSLTKIRHDVQSRDARTELWYRIGTLSGAQTVSITMDAANDVVAGAISFTGAHQTSPIGNHNGATNGGSSTASVTVTSATGEIVVDTVAVESSITLTVGSGQTERWNMAEGPGAGTVTGGGSTEAGASSVTMSWSLSTSTKGWSISAVSIKPAIPDYDVYLEIWNKATDSVSETIGSCADVITYGDDVQCLISGVGAKTLSSDQVVRLRVRHSSNSGTVRIEYDDADSTGDSRATIPIPEFETIVLPVAFVALCVVVVRARRGRVRRRAEPSRPQRQGLRSRARRTGRGVPSTGGDARR